MERINKKYNPETNYKVSRKENFRSGSITNEKLAGILGSLEKDRSITDIYLEIAGVIIIVLDKKGIVEFINKKGCDVLGIEKSSIIGKNWFENYVPQQHSRKIYSHFKTLMHGKEPEKFFENSIVNKGGEERLIYWHTSVIKDSKGKINGLISSGEDITENRKLQDEIIVQSKNSDFLYVLSKMVSDAANLKDMISKASKLLADFPGMLGGIICIDSNNGNLGCDEEVIFGSFKKILNNKESLFNDKFKKYKTNGNLHEIENLYNDLYGSKHKGYACAYRMKTKNEGSVKNFV